RFQRLADAGVSRPSTKSVLRRILPRLVSYRYLENIASHEFDFEGSRASSVHVLSHLFETDYKFRLEDLSHFATHGEHVLAITHAVGLHKSIDPEAILYCPALDGPFPFKFVLTGRGTQSNRAAYVALLKQLLRKTESDEDFRERSFRELSRGFEKFGPAAATPEFQQVDLKVWRILTYLAARLRVKAGRLTDSTEIEQVQACLHELHQVHDSLSQLVYLPSRLAARFRNRFDLELSMLTDEALPELDAIANQIDLDLDEHQLALDETAKLVSEFRRLGSAAPIECLAEIDQRIKASYGRGEVPPAKTGWMRRYTETIFTGAERFDTRRFGSGAASTIQQLEESTFELDLSKMNFGFGAAKPEDADSEDDLESSSLDHSAWDMDSGFGSEVDDAWGE
ncbi:MAG: hypothetical protein JKY65_08670, partial [Planctomycetes bacterium]|nr:hypothetical protein [Planctomycetota bacterium]